MSGLANVLTAAFGRGWTAGSTASVAAFNRGPMTTPAAFVIPPTALPRLPAIAAFGRDPGTIPGGATVPRRFVVPLNSRSDSRPTIASAGRGRFVAPEAPTPLGRTPVICGGMADP